MAVKVKSTHFMMKMMMLLILMSSTTYAYTFKDISNVNAYAKGNAVTAAEIGLDGIHKNPASLGSIKKITFLSSYSSHFQMATLSQFGVAFPIQNVNIGFNLPLKYISDIPLTAANSSNQGEQIGSFSDIQAVGMMSVSTKFDYKTTIGCNINLYGQKLYNQRAMGLGLDVGAIIDNKEYQLGIAIQDINNTSIKWSTGYEEKLLPKLNIGIKKETEFGGTIFVDSSIQSNTPFVGNIGYEFNLAKTFRVSLGLNDVTGIKKVTCGTSLELDTIELNYSFSQLETLGSSHNIGLKFTAF